MRMIDYSLAYAKKGWPVLPLHSPDGHGGCSCRESDCKSIGKHPHTQNGLKDATTDEAKIRRWWDMWPDANIGIRTGAEANIAVLDVDPRNGGNKSLAALEMEHGTLPETLTSSTGGGGRHILFVRPEGKLHKTAGEGLDIKGDGGYIVAPPSVHASGKRYEWGADKPTAEMPEWLLRQVTREKAVINGKAGAADYAEADISTWDGLNAETRRRILAHDSASITSDRRWAEAKGLCHNGKGNTAIYVNLASGAYGCHKKCSAEAIRHAFGLPASPVRGGSEMGPPAPLGVSWREFSARKFTEADSIIAGLERGEVGLLNAATNIGKTTLSLNLALALAAGMEFLPLVRKGGVPRRVLVIDGETRQARLQRDIRTMERSFYRSKKELVKDNLFIMCDAQLGGVALTLSNAVHMAAVRGEAAWLKPDLIVIDTLAELFTVTNENDNAEMQNKVMRPLNQLALETGAAILVLHHIGKMSEEALSSTQAYRGRGASSIGGSARLVLTLMPDKKAERVVTLSCAKSKGEWFEPTLLRLDQEARTFRVVGSCDATPESTYELVVKTVVGFNRPARRKEIEEALRGRVPLSTLGKHLNAAVKREALDYPKHGYYQAPKSAHSLNAIRGEQLRELELIG